MSLSGLTGTALSALTYVAYSTYLSPRALLCFRKTRFGFLCFHKILATEFCVSTKKSIQNFVFPPNVKRDFVFPQIFVSALSLDT